MKNNIFWWKIINFAFLAIAVFLLGCQSHQTSRNYKSGDLDEGSDNRKIKIIEVLQELSSIKYSQPHQVEENRHKITKVIDKLESAEDLMTLALMSKTLARNCTDVDCFKASTLRPTYENAYWEVVKQLAVKKEENKRVLDELKVRSQLSGTDVGDWERIVEGKEFP